MGAVYSREQLRRVREVREAKPGQQLRLLERVPEDAPMDPGIAIGFWNGERFVSWQRWRASQPLIADQPSDPGASAECVTATCGGTRIWLVRDGDRWLMYAGSRKAAARRRDFASPFLDHAKRTAEQWYGVAGCGWREERKPDARSSNEDRETDDPHVHGETGAPLLAAAG